MAERTGAVNLPNGTDNDDRKHLEAKAHEIEKWAEERFIDGNGVVYTAIDKDTQKPLDRSLFDDASEAFLPSYRPEEFWSYENCGMCTGAYLQAMVFRYRVEKDPSALARAGRCFRALKYIYEIGKEYEEGFFPKIYGNKFTMQTSSDQVLYCVMALDQYWPLAKPEEQAQISRMIGEMVKFWVRHGYRFRYYTQKEISWPLVRFPALLLLAYEHTGDDAFKKEYDRLLDMGVTDKPEFDRLNAKRSGRVATAPYEQEAGAWVINNSTPDMFAMDVMQFDYKLRHDPQNERHEKWKAGIALMWDEAKIMLAPDGKAYYCVLVDMKTGEVKRPEQVFRNELPEPVVGLADAKWGHSTMTARAAVQARYFFPENEDMASIAKRILESLNTQDLVEMENVGAEAVARSGAHFRYRDSFIGGDAMSNWLWAYWQGRFQQLW